MESKTLVCDRCAAAGKFIIAVDAATISTRTHAFRLDLCTDHLASLVKDLGAFNTDHIVHSILEHVLQDRGKVGIGELRRIAGASRKVFNQALRLVIEAKKARVEGRSKQAEVIWIAPRENTNGAKIELRDVRGELSRRAIEWMRDLLKERKQIGARDVAREGKEAGFTVSNLKWARDVLKREKVLRLKGITSRSTYIYT